jgi:hypothetical protein
VEDRVTPTLWLEFSQDDPAAFAAARAPALAAHPGITRVTWWENLVPNRTDLPRRLPEFRTLGVAEAAAGIAAPNGDGHLFHHYPRPGQGRLTGRPTVGLSLVLISPRRDEDAQSLRDWGDFVHLSHIAAVGVPGYTMITPYERAGGGTPRFLHFYEMDTDDPEAAFKAMTPLVEKRLGPAGTPDFDHWARHPSLWIEYVNSFKLVGALDA